MIIQYTVSPNQNIYDVAVQFYGTVEGVMRILEDNPAIDVNMDITGVSISINTEVVIGEAAYAKRIIAASQQTVATGGQNYISPWVTSEGVPWFTAQNNYFSI